MLEWDLQVIRLDIVGSAPVSGFPTTLLFLILNFISLSLQKFLLH